MPYKNLVSFTQLALVLLWIMRNIHINSIWMKCGLILMCIVINCWLLYDKNWGDYTNNVTVLGGIGTNGTGGYACRNVTAEQGCHLKSGASARRSHVSPADTPISPTPYDHLEGLGSHLINFNTELFINPSKFHIRNTTRIYYNNQ